MSFSDLFKSKKQTTTLEPMLTPEQQKIMSMLSGYATTGSAGGITAGAPIDLSGFDFDMTGGEK